MIMRSTIVFSFFFLFVNASANEKLKLIFLQLFYRHGDRSPLKLYPNDPNPESVWPEGLGALSLLGKRQHFELGILLRSLYKDFITTSPREINVTSSDSDRCIESAEANTATFYSPTQQWQFDENVIWQPIPVHVFQGIADRILDTDSSCPRSDEEVERILNSPESKKYFADHKDMYDNLTAITGTPIYNWTAIYDLYDTLWIEKRYELITPDLVDDYWEELERGMNLYFYFHFKSTLLKRLRAGPLLKLMIEKMKRKISGDLPYQKVQVYSSHDTNIAVFLESLGLYPWKMPPYCATVALELYKGNNNSNFIRMLYLNSTELDKSNQTPHVLVLKGCSEFCPLEYFVNKAKPYIVDDINEECQSTQWFWDYKKWLYFY